VKPLTRQQVREVDRRAIDEYGLPGMVLMENAARGCVEHLLRLGVRGPVAICCGKGNNGGDGFAIARWLDLHHIPVRTLVWASPGDLQGDALLNYQILKKSGAAIDVLNDSADERFGQLLSGVDWVVDALLGTGATGDPRAPLDGVISQLNAAPCFKLAVDLPSGLDCDTGQVGSPVFIADHTCTFVAPKTGFQAPAAKACLGQVHVVPIGAPRKLLEEIASE